MTFSLLLAGVWLLLLAFPAAAHTGFESSDPKDGAVVTGTVDEVTLTFSGPAEPTGERFLVLDGSGELRTPTGLKPNDERTKWTLEFAPPLVEGPTGLRWTVQAPDAHPISGSLSFSIEPEAALPGKAEASNALAAESVESESEDERTTIDPSGVDGESSTSSTVIQADEELTDFLEVVPWVYGADVVSALGRAVAFAASALAIGALVFASRVVRHRRPEVVTLLKVVAGAAMLIPLGAMVDFLGLLAVANGSWTGFWEPGLVDDIAYTDTGFAVYLRAVAGIAFAGAALLQLRNLPLHVATNDTDRALLGGGALVGPAVRAEAGREEAGRETLGRTVDVEERTSGSRLSPPAVAAAAVLVASFSFDGHTATEGDRWLTSAADAAHVMASSIWAGGVVAFAVVLRRRHRLGQQLSGFDLAVRFSVVASVALVVASAAGVALTAVILDQPAQLWTTDWGRLLLIKVAAVALAAGIGGYSHFFVVPSLESDPTSGDSALGAASRLRRTVSVEAAVLLTVVAITAVLVGASAQ